MLALTPEQETILQDTAQKLGTDSRTLLTEIVKQLPQISHVLTLSPQSPAVVRRKPGLSAGKIEMADDFNAPLPDDFWEGTS